MALVHDTPPAGRPASPEALIPEARELQRRRVRRRWGAALLGALILAGGGIVVFGAGGSPALPSVRGPLPAGIVARAGDPAGGLPWGLRVVRTSGWTCVQLGRLRGDQLGVIGKDGSYGDDGRFHPFAPSTTNQVFCAQDDAHGHAFMTIQLGALPASGVGAGNQTATQCRTAAEVARMKRILRIRYAAGLRALIEQVLICPQRDLRFIQYGLLGPDANAITYTYDGRHVVERTHGADGAYLVVGPATPSFCSQMPQGSFCGGNGDAPSSLFGGMILAVHYRNGQTCQPATLGTRLPASMLQCSRIGYVAPKALLRASQVAASVSFRLIPAASYCWQPSSSDGRYGFGTAAATDLGGYLPCTAGLSAADKRPGLVQHGVLVVSSWTARQPVTSTNTDYEFFLGSDRCGGDGGSTGGRITAGEGLTRGLIVQSRCAGTLTGTVAYQPNLGPGGGGFAGDDPGHDGSILVGRFTIHISAHTSRPY
ncbi:MAG: hypothetical protein ACLP01_28510 [Solirubrobacteraceae bacterium]